MSIKKKKNIIIAVACIFAAGFFTSGTEFNIPFSGNFEKNFVLIPKGAFRLEELNDQDMPAYGPPKKYSIKVDSFYISKYEVSNLEYRQFIYSSAYTDSAYQNLLPDTSVWINNYNEPYAQYYFRHPAYDLYPVVGINYEQANAYCLWLTKEYKKWGKGKYTDAEFLLPTEDQWRYAASTPLNNVFPWEGQSMQNKKCQWRANFSVIEQQNIGKIIVPVMTWTNKVEERTFIGTKGFHTSFLNPNSSMEVTSPVKSFWPNGFGLYNMAGNVEEMVREKGISKGGSWKDTGYYLLNSSNERYDSTEATSAERGFRIIMQIKNK